MDYTLHEIKDRINLADMAEGALGLKRRHGRFWCPFDDSGRPNLSIKRRSYHCFRCGARGDAFDLVARLHGCTFAEALAWVCDYANIPVPRGPRAPSWTPPPGALMPEWREEPEAPKGPTPRTVKILTAFSRPWAIAADWPEDNPACRYLAGRGISRETAARLGVGFLAAPYEVVRDKLLAKASMDDLKAAGLFNEKGNLRLFKHRLLLPAWLDGQALGMFARNIGWQGEDEGPKEVSVSYPPIPFNADALLDAPERVFITEGAIDCLSMEEMGLRAVAIPGTGAFRPEWVSLFDGVSEVVLALDNDDAGREGAAKIAQAFAAAGRDGIKSVRWPDGVKDANEFLTASPGGKGVAL